ncbi:MAG: hypothetical protein AAFV07_01835 [Bacteroidota bacterium]
MAKKFTRKKLRLRARARIRRRKLKVAPQTRGLKTSLQQENLPVLAALEKKVAEAAAQA